MSNKLEELGIVTSLQIHAGIDVYLPGHEPVDNIVAAALGKAHSLGKSEGAKDTLEVLEGLKKEIAKLEGEKRILELSAERKNLWGNDELHFSTKEKLTSRIDREIEEIKSRIYCSK